MQCLHNLSFENKKHASAVKSTNHERVILHRLGEFIWFETLRSGALVNQLLNQLTENFHYNPTLPLNGSSQQTV